MSDFAAGIGLIVASPLCSRLNYLSNFKTDCRTVFSRPLLLTNVQNAMAIHPIVIWLGTKVFDQTDLTIIGAKLFWALVGMIHYSRTLFVF